MKRLFKGLIVAICVMGIGYSLSSCAGAKLNKEQKKKADQAKLDSLANMERVKDKYSTQLDVSKDSLRHLEVYTYFDNWIGYPYAKESTDKAISDVDLITGFYKTVLNKNVPGSDFNELLNTQLIEYYKNSKSLYTGDLIYFLEYGKKVKIISEDDVRRFVEKERDVESIGFYLQNGYFITSSKKMGAVTIESLSDPFWDRRLAFYGRLK